jgi:hypothetical protein
MVKSQECYLVSLRVWTPTSEPKWIFLGIFCWHQCNFFWHMGWNIQWCGGIFCRVAMDKWFFYDKNGWTFIKNGCQIYKKSWMSHYLTHKRWNNIMLVLSWKIQHLKHWEIFQIILHIFLIWIYTTSKPFRI